MTAGTVTVDPELARGLLDDALAADAGREPDGLAAEPPPRQPWLNEDGTAKYGLKADGTPRKSRPGTGRPPKDEAARTADRLPAAAAADGPRSSAGPGGGGRDYAGDIGGALTMAWMGMAVLPATKPHAAVLKPAIPRLAAAWGTAAENNAAIRRYAEKLSGDGSLAWVIPVTLTTAQLGVGILQAARDPQLRAQLAAQTDHDFRSFLAEQAQAAGMDLETGQGGPGGDGWPASGTEPTISLPPSSS